MIIAKASPAFFKNSFINLTTEQRQEIERLANGISLASILKLIDIFQKSFERLKNASLPHLPLELAIVEVQLTLRKTVEAESVHAKSGHSSVVNDNTRKENALTWLSPQSQSQKPETTEQLDEKEEDKTGNNSEEASVSRNPVAFTKKKVTDASSQEKEISVQDNTIAGKETVDRGEGDNISQNTGEVSLIKIMENWKKILNATKPYNHSIHAFLKNCAPQGIIENVLYIKTKYDFYKDKLNERQNLLTVQKAIAKIVQGDLKVKFLTEEEVAGMDFKDDGAKKKGEGDILYEAMKILGGEIIRDEKSKSKGIGE
jgi:hypothetical protein